jgi:DNA polymerase/3'-5' exonuclease PolX
MAPGVPLEEARRAARALARGLRFGGRPLRRRPEVLPVGSVRRGTAARVKDLDLLVVAPAGAIGRGLLAGAALPRGWRLRRVRAAGPRRRALDVASPAGRRFRVDLFAAAPGERPFALLHFTGPWRYNVRLRARAKARGWRLNQYGLFGARSGRPVPGPRPRSERALAARLGVRFRAPSAR